MSINIQESETKNNIVNSKIRICIECGSKTILVDDHVIYCKDCNSNFIIDEEV
jgi:DNA-directed RNA polymerase subunit RPC12/RpoP